MKTNATLYVYKTPGQFGEPDGIEVKSYDSTNHTYHCHDILLDTVEVEVEFSMPSEREILDKVVIGLKAAKAAIEAKAYLDTKAIQDKIDSLLCLEHKEVTA